MDLKLDKEHLLLQQMYRAFAENEVEPVAADVDATEEVPMENVKKNGQIRLLWNTIS